METALADLSLFDRPAWPFVAGRFGGLALALAALVMTFGCLAPSPKALIDGYYLFTASALVLAIGCLGAAKQGHATIGPFFGCLAILGTSALAWNADTANPATLVPVARAVIYAFAVFPLSFVFARGLTYVRVCAALAAIPAVGLAALSSTRGSLGETSVHGLLAIAFVMLMVLGIAIATSLPGLRRTEVFA